MNYREQLDDSKYLKQDYLDGVMKWIDTRNKEAAQKRKEYCKNILTNPDAYRENVKKVLGWPLVDQPYSGIPSVKTTKLADEDGYSIYRMQFEILDGLEMAGLYFEMHTTEKKPLVLVLHGGLGTPELIAGVYGHTANYSDMLQRVTDRGVHAFAPQLLLWDKSYGVEFDRIDVDARLRRVGGSVTALELFGMMRILDYFETRDNVSNFGMVGMSYGGFFTQYLAALDTRILSSVSCGYFSTRDKYLVSDWSWLNAAEKFNDTELACLVYPRKLCLEMGTKDNLFDSQYTIDSYENIKELCKEVGMDWAKLIIFEGYHEFCWDDEPIDAMIEHIS